LYGRAGEDAGGARTGTPSWPWRLVQGPRPPRVYDPKAGRPPWADHDGPLPIIEGTVIRLVVEKLPSGGVNKPVWVWWPGSGATTAEADRCWQSFLRRDVEHTFRLFKQTRTGTSRGYGARRRRIAGPGW
jgi:hypothetical protein